MNWKIKRVKLSDIKEYEANPRKMTEKGLSDLKKSIKNFGQAEPLVVNTDMVLIGGHARKLAMESLDYDKCDVLIPDVKLTDKQFQELNIRLNRNVAGTFDFEKLSDFFETDDLLEWGFEGFELETDLKEPDDSELNASNIDNKPVMKITFQSPEDLKEAQNGIDSVLESIEGAYYTLSSGEL